MNDFDPDFLIQYKKAKVQYIWEAIQCTAPLPYMRHYNAILQDVNIKLAFFDFTTNNVGPKKRFVQYFTFSLHFAVSKKLLYLTIRSFRFPRLKVKDCSSIESDHQNRASTGSTLLSGRVNKNSVVISLSFYITVCNI